MVIIIVMIFIIGLSVNIVFETIDAINDARGKPTNYTRVLGYIGDGFQMICDIGLVVLSFALVLMLGITIILMIKMAVFG